MPVSAGSFRALKAARRTIREAMNIERNYWALVENFRDYENELLQIPLAKALSHSFDWEEVQIENAMIDRRVLNLLASARAFLDQLNKITLNQFPDEAAAIKAHCSAEYDARLGYRVMELLRNIRLHVGLPLVGLSYPHDRHDNGLRMRVVPSIAVQALKEVGIKGKELRVVEELASFGEAHDLTPHVRDYLEGLGSIQKKTRALTAGKVNEACNQYERLHARAERHFGKDSWSVGFMVGKLDPMASLGLADKIEVFLNFPRYCQKLRRQNNTLDNFTKLFISSQLNPADKQRRR